MNKKWLISIVIIALLVVVGSVFFQKSSEEATDQTEEIETPAIDEHGNPIEEGQPSTEDDKQPISNDKPGNQADSDDPLNKEGNEEELDKPSSSVNGSETNDNGTNSTTNGDQVTGHSGTGSTNNVEQQKPGAGGSNTGATNSGGQSKPVEKKESVTSIKNRYFSEFQQIEWQQNGKIESLANRALNDYMNDSSSFNANNYKAEAKSLQASADSAFYGKYSEMQAELAANGHSKQAASDIEQTYQSKKAAKESELKSLVGG